MSAAGAKPLFFLDYIACGKNVPEKIAQIVAGVAEGCVQAGVRPGRRRNRRACPACMPEDEYDLAGFSVGVVDKEKIIDREEMQAGDVLIGPAVHGRAFQRLLPGAQGVRHRAGGREPRLCRAGAAFAGKRLLTPTRIYVKPVLKLLSQMSVPGPSRHITGGGFYENIPRMPQGGHDRPY